MEINEVILCKYGEIILKGLNKGWFEKKLMRDLRARLTAYGEFYVHNAQSTVYIEPKNEDADIDGAFSEAKKVFGFSAVSRAAKTEKEIGAICRLAAEYCPQFISGKKTFKVECRRADKRFPMTSPQVSAEVGGAILDVCPDVRADMKNPDIMIRVEIREDSAFVHGGAEKGQGGLPAGTNGRALLLLSGGIDSPVAGYMMARRGVSVEALHFESFPYTSERAKEKVLKLAELMAGYTGTMKVHVISLTEIQEKLRDTIDEEYFTLLLRRHMMRLADRCAAEFDCTALVTGESLGQVASQTMPAIAVTDIVAARPVFRPCIGMDKDEIVDTARRIGTFETSILPYEDCCTVFTPPHPKTRPELEKVLAQEAKMPIAELEERAWASLETFVMKKY